MGPALQHADVDNLVSLIKLATNLWTMGGNRSWAEYADDMKTHFLLGTFSCKLVTILYTQFTSRAL